MLASRHGRLLLSRRTTTAVGSLQLQLQSFNLNTRSSSTTTTTTVAAAKPNPKPKQPVPVPSGSYPFVGHLPRLISGGESVQNWEMLHQECGEIFEINVMGKEIVVTNNPKHAKVILMHQGSYPYRTPQKSWATIFEQQKWPAGIAWATGDDWKRKRAVLGETLLMQKHAKQYVPHVIPAANRMVDCLTGHLNSEGRLTESVRLLSGMFALEAVMKVVVGGDFQALTVPLPPDAVQFQQAVETMFTETSVVESIPLHITFKTARYQRLTQAWKTMYSFPQQTLQPILDHYNEHGKLPDQVHGTVLPKLMERHEEGELTLDEVLGIGVQAIAGAVDTTGQTTEYLFYNLAAHFDVQERIVQQLAETTGGTTDEPLQLTVEEYSNQKYLFAVLKESMRLTPTIGAHARTLVQDADLGDFVIPKGKLVLMNYLSMTQNPDHYPSPHLFLPERFLKDKTETAACPMQHHHSSEIVADEKQAAIRAGHAVSKDPYAAIPFGHGARKCVGKAFAELDIHLLALAVLRKYRIEYDGPPLEQREQNLLRPSVPLWPHFRFVPRE
uniref:Cytochrome P450 n=1 Tax=Attheya septentrionalis TaxID=420275 RepID=A0A7S2UPH7_9STRA|mmetsp:Transcript_7173/g.12865  ORF Transcript_7173/g.12865 Transcript_7173/m.12865 type:complete len:556 (+) Transcript_7173:137-1804(+)